MLKKLVRRLQYLLNRRRLDQELASELEFHREMISRNKGISLGNTLRLREESRDAWGWTWLDRCSQDLRYAARMLRKSPSFTITAVLMLALGIGVNVAAFGFFNLMVLRPLPVRNPASILFFERHAPEGGGNNFVYPEVAFYREHATALSAIWALSFSQASLEGEPKPIAAHFVTANFFQELGGTASAGRLLDPHIDEAANAAPVVVLSQLFWQTHFASDPSIIGKTIRLNNKPVTVIGIASNNFTGMGLDRPKIWLPINQAPYLLSSPQLLNDFAGTGISVQMWGRLPPGVTPKTAEGELKSLAAELHRQHPQDVWKDQSLPSSPGGYPVTVRPEMYPLLALATALGLLILAAACITLGSLLLAKSTARDREISIRSAIGASRTRLVRQLLTESLALAALGSAAGVLLGYMALRVLMVWTDTPPSLNPTPDGRVILFALSIGFLATLFFGLTPALQVARQRPQHAVKLRQFLMAAQIAASCVLLIVAGLLVRALQHAVSTNPGFAYNNIISLDPNFHGYTPAQARTYFDRLQSRLQAIIGIESMSLVSNPPLGHRWTVGAYSIAGRQVNVHFNNIDAPFFQTMNIPLLAGRNLQAGSQHEIVISETLARLAWPSENPLGKQLKAAAGDTVVGICGNAHLVSPEDSDAVEVYRWAQPDLTPSMVLLLRTARPPESVAPLVASLAHSADPKLFPEVELLKSLYKDKINLASYAALSVGLLGLLALLLACIGIFGLTVYVVSHRTKEIGIRMALGATPSHVLTVILRQFSIPVFAGLFLGIAGAAALSQILSRLLYGLSSFDPLAYLSSVSFFALGVGLAALLPAKRALRIDPMKALRYD